MKKLIRLADVKEYLPLLDKEEITLSRFAELLNERANDSLNEPCLKYSLEEISKLFVGEGQDDGYFNQYLDYYILHKYGENRSDKDPLNFKMWFESYVLKNIS